MICLRIGSSILLWRAVLFENPSPEEFSLVASSSVAFAPHAAASARRIALARLPLAGLLTIAVAAVLNVGLFFVFSAVGVLTDAVLIQTFVGPQPLTAAVVASNTVIQMLIGVAVLAAIARVWPARAERIWQIVASVVLVLSFWMPFAGIPGAPVAYSLALDAMHVVAAALAIWLLPSLARGRLPHEA
jgi:hypothetical protein